MVFWVCKQIEGAVMRSKNVANEQKTEALAFPLTRPLDLWSLARQEPVAFLSKARGVR